MTHVGTAFAVDYRETRHGHAVEHTMEQVVRKWFQAAFPVKRIDERQPASNPSEKVPLARLPLRGPASSGRASVTLRKTSR